MSLAIEAPAPPFTLPDTDGTPTPLHDDDSAATAVVFTCNHCPYALAWHDRLQAVARDYQDRGVRFLSFFGGVSADGRFIPIIGGASSSFSAHRKFVLDVDLCGRCDVGAGIFFWIDQG